MAMDTETTLRLSSVRCRSGNRAPTAKPTSAAANTSTQTISAKPGTSISPSLRTSVRNVPRSTPRADPSGRRLCIRDSPDSPRFRLFITDGSLWPGLLTKKRVQIPRHGID